MSSSLFKISLIIMTFYGFFGSSNVIAAKAPDFKLEGQQKQVNLSKYRGNIVYVDFWASWCQPCRKSFAWMNKMQALYGEEGLKVIAINLDESRDKAEKFLKQVPANFIVAFDPKGVTAESYQVKAMPSSYLVDKNGNLVHANLGFRGDDEDELEVKIRDLIKKSTVASR